MKHVLIIGGMGPQASVHAHKRLLDAAHTMAANTNQAYPRVTHLSINVPDFISDNSKKHKARHMLIEALKEVSMGSVTHAFVACNTAHVLFDDLAEVVGNQKLISLVETTRGYVASIPGPNKKIALLATPSTIRSRLYDVDIVPTKEQQDVIEVCIRSLISNASPEDTVAPLNLIISDFVKQGATHVILGCTELSMANPLLHFPDLIDPIDIVTKKIMES